MASPCENFKRTVAVICSRTKQDVPRANARLTTGSSARPLRPCPDKLQQADEVTVVPLLSNGIGGVAVSGIMSALWQPGAGTAINGLRPDPPPSVTSSGTAPSPNVDVSTAAGEGGAEGGEQFPDEADVPNWEFSVASGSVGPSGKFAVAGAVAMPLAVGSLGSTGRPETVPAIALAGHDVMVPTPMPAIGAARLRWIAPNAEPEEPAAGPVTLAGAPAGGLAGLDAGATCAKVAPQPANITDAVIRNKRRI